MRRVQVFKYKRNETTNRFEILPDGEAWFHQWGTDYEEFEGGPGNFTTAVIERDDGKVENPPSHMIKFLEPINEEVPGE